MRDLIITVPTGIRESLYVLTTRVPINRCKSFRLGRLKSPMAAAKHALRSLARRYFRLDKEIENLLANLEHLH